MRIAVDISLYPLTMDYIAPIDDVIERFKRYPNVAVDVNRFSTQLTGEYSDVMALLARELEPSLAGPQQSVFVVKFLNADKAGY